MRDGVNRTTRLDLFVGILKSLGGRATARDIAIASIDRGDIFSEEEIDKAAETWATRKVSDALKRPCDDGLPSAISTPEYVLDEDGTNVEMNYWVQRDLWEPDQFMDSLRRDVKRTKDDIASILKKLNYGRDRWPGPEWDSLQKEFQKEIDFGSSE